MLIFGEIIEANRKYTNFYPTVLGCAPGSWWPGINIPWKNIRDERIWIWGGLFLLFRGIFYSFFLCKSLDESI